MGNNELQEILRELRRPFPAESVHFKIQLTSKANPDKKLIVAYVDARDVAERLTAVVPSAWNDKYKPIYSEPNGGYILGVECTITMFIGDSSIIRSDVGEGDLENPMGALKGFYSDAFKRAAVKYGVATSLYDLPQIWEEFEGKYIPRKIMDELTDRYAKWLNRKEIVAKFGSPYEL